MIFLSASIPKIDSKYYHDADIVAIRDAVRALASVVIPKSQLIWGGHPAITPLIRFVVESMQVDLKNHITLYQSEYFLREFPKDNEQIENIVLVPSDINKRKSLHKMRAQMFSEREFKAGVFIGGMKGVEEEYALFKKMQPNAQIFPIASTGAAAKVIFEKSKQNLNNDLLTSYSYMSLFKSLLF